LAITEVKRALDQLYAGFNHPDSATDPIHIVRRFDRDDDREVVAFIAAALAFGRVSSVLQSIERVLAVIGPAPADYIRRFDARRQGPAFAGIVHRWTREADIVAMLWLLRQMIDRAGSVEGFFLEGYDADADDIVDALDSFSTRAMALDLKAAYGRVPKRPGVCYFFPRPSAGSACKRLNLFLRWMVRRDALDLGVWKRVSPAKLIVPLDTHVIRVGRCLRLTKYTSGVADGARHHRFTAPAGPNRIRRPDFSICHLGMMNACGFAQPRGDAQCPPARLQSAPGAGRAPPGTGARGR
jgi:uncharacterized protein (TIGR02757 family)